MRSKQPRGQDSPGRVDRLVSESVLGLDDPQVFHERLEPSFFRSEENPVFVRLFNEGGGLASISLAAETCTGCQ